MDQDQDQAGGRKKTSLKVASWNKGGANQDLDRKINEIRILLQEYDIDCLGILEANLKITDNMENVQIPGYLLVWDKEKAHQTKASGGSLYHGRIEV